MLFQVGGIVRKSVVERAEDVLFLKQTDNCNSHYFIFNAVNHSLFEAFSPIVLENEKLSDAGKLEVQRHIDEIFTEKWY